MTHALVKPRRVHGKAVHLACGAAMTTDTHSAIFPALVSCPACLDRIA